MMKQGSLGKTRVKSIPVKGFVSKCVILIPEWWAGLPAEAGWAGPPEGVVEGVEGCVSSAAALRWRWRWGRGSEQGWVEGWEAETAGTASGRGQGRRWSSGRLEGSVSGEFEECEWRAVGRCWCRHSAWSQLSSSGLQTGLGTPPPGCWQTAASLKTKTNQTIFLV